MMVCLRMMRLRSLRSEFLEGRILDTPGYLSDLPKLGQHLFLISIKSMIHQISEEWDFLPSTVIFRFFLQQSS